jgi:glycosyltransferase involved in cell wall biosynthesis
VLPVYAGVDYRHLQLALQSIADQTEPPDEVILVEDGPLGPDLSGTIRAYAERLPLVVIRLPENRGAGPANHAGLIAARMPLVAKMDADDIMLPRRIEEQLRLIRRDDVDLVGCAMKEFVDIPENVIGVRRMPEHHDEILRYLRTNNPLNHPTLLYSRELAVQVGGYRDLPYLEDYDFCARMLAAGARAYNMPEPLQLFRSGGAALDRRRDAQLFRSEGALQRLLHEYGIITRRRAVLNYVVRSAFRLVPKGLAYKAYRTMFLKDS